MNTMIIERSERIEFKESPEIAGISLNSVTVTRLRIPLSMTFAISLGKQDFYDAVIVETVMDGTKGYGEAETIQQITGESPEVLYDVALGIARSLDGTSVESIEALASLIGSYCHGNTAAKSGVEMSIWDAISRHHRVNLSRMLGGSLKPRSTSLTIPIGGVKENLDLLSKYQMAGAKIIKVKVGMDVGSDIDRIKQIAGNLNNGVRFFVDANQGFNLSQAIRISGVLSRTEALFMEQPMPRHDFRGLADLRKKTDIPIMLDESISAPQDVINAVLYGSADMINVKLSKSGGIRNALKILHTAEAAGMDAMVGCMLESKLGISASLAVANSAGNVKFTDLDGFTYLKEQPFAGGVELRNGMDIPMDGYGLSAEKTGWDKP